MNNKEKILNFIKNNNKIKPSDISKKINLSRSMIFRHLKDLVIEEKIVKNGMTPHV